MTNGSAGGTNGGAGFSPGPWLSIVLVGLAIATVNATSVIMERGDEVAWHKPVIWEFSSAVVIIALAPLVGRAVRRWPPSQDTLPRFALVHLALTIPFSLVHVAAIYVIRSLIYWAAGERYGFFDDGVAVVLLYEWRKDVLTYALLGAVYWVFDYLAQRRQARAPLGADERIEVRDGAAATFLAPADILYLEAAGNYVEFHTQSRTHLVRGTLAAWEAKLAPRGFARVHRSRLVNRARIAALRPTPSGDVEITLDDGRALTGSRRYRAALEAVGPSP